MNAESNENGQQGGSMILFVTGDSPRSQRARSNLARALQEAGRAADEAEEVDLLAQPEKVTEYRIFATPALLSCGEGGQPAVLYGDLSDRNMLAHFLDNR